LEDRIRLQWTVEEHGGGRGVPKTTRPDQEKSGTEESYREPHQTDDLPARGSAARGHDPGKTGSDDEDGGVRGSRTGRVLDRHL
jgi:hypothetical protein